MPDTLTNRNPIAALEQRIRTLEMALRFYANPKNWESPSTGFASQYDPEPSPVERVGAKLARNALKGTNREQV